MSRAVGAGGLALALLLALAGEGCRWFRRTPKTPAATPSPPVSAPAPPPPAAAPAPPPEIAPPPQLPPGQPQIGARPPVEPPKPAPPPRVRRRVRPAARPAPEPAPEPQSEAPKPPPPLPQLQQILTSEQEREANQAIDQSSARVQRALAAFQGRTLTSEQATAIARIRALLQQARQMRKTDLLAAQALAERAAVLADDLLKTLR